MSEAEERPRGRAGRLTSAATTFVVKRPRSQKLGALAGVALLVTAPFGGLRSAADVPPEHVSVDKPLMVGPFRFTFVKAVTVSDLEPAAKPSVEGGRLFVIEARVSNPGERPEPVIELTRALTVQDAGVAPDTDGSAATPDMYDVDDSTTLSGSINPGVSYLVALVWDQQPGWTGDHARLRIARQEYRDKDPLTLDDHTWWLMDDALATATVPVEVKK
ncbi:MAG TPA: hypothetical protein VF426_00980 [Marmoricola sp.]